MCACCFYIWLVVILAYSLFGIFMFWDEIDTTPWWYSLMNIVASQLWLPIILVVILLGILLNGLPLTWEKLRGRK